jgi:hypothetical protein
MPVGLKGKTPILAAMRTPVWDAAAQEQRNWIAWQHIAEAVIQDKDVTNVKLRPAVAGVFALPDAQRQAL